MEKGSCSRCAAHLCPGIAQPDERAGSEQTNGGLLWERLSRKHSHEHFETARVQRALECSRQLGSMEKGEAASGRSRERMNSATALPRRSFGETMRSDVLWLQSLLVFLGLSTFIVYSTWAAFQGKNYFVGNYISPFYSPELFGDSPHSWFGPKRASLFSLPGAVFSRRTRYRRLEGALVFRRIRNRRRHNCPRDQRCLTRR